MTLAPVVERLVRRGVRITRESHIALAYTDAAPELDAESEAMVRVALAYYRAAQLAVKVIRRARR